MKKIALISLLLMVTLLVGELLSNGIESNVQNSSNEIISAEVHGGNKVLICHIPPGNPSNSHMISVSPNAVAAHLAHGDKLGPCYVYTDPIDGEDIPKEVPDGEGIIVINPDIVIVNPGGDGDLNELPGGGE